jgi:8-oxoguanine DNA glycosylase, N-terminal domain
MTFHRLPVVPQDLNLALVLKSGQSFRWRVSGPNEWFLPNDLVNNRSCGMQGRIITLRQDCTASFITDNSRRSLLSRSLPQHTHKTRRHARPPPLLSLPKSVVTGIIRTLVKRRFPFQKHCTTVRGRACPSTGSMGMSTWIYMQQ